MIHPLLRLIATHPGLVGDHAQAYAALLGEDLGRSTAKLKRRAAFGAAAACLGVVALLLGGIALMLWAVSPPSALHAPWVLIAVPLVPALLAVACGLACRAPAESPFDNLKQQFAEDMRMLREVGAA